MNTVSAPRPALARTRAAPCLSPSPHTRAQVVGTIPAATAEDVDAAVDAAVAAMAGKQWSGRSGTERARCLRAIAELVSGLGCGWVGGWGWLGCVCVGGWTWVLHARAAPPATHPPVKPPTHPPPTR